LSKKKCKDTSIQVNLMMIRAASTNLKGWILMMYQKRK
jgi:hypothetical protein